MAGTTSSPDFPCLSATQTALGGSSDAFLARLSAAELEVTYATYLGGSGVECVNSISAGFLGDIFVAGESTSPVMVPQLAPVRAHVGTGYDGFVAHLSSLGVPYLVCVPRWVI